MVFNNQIKFKLIIAPAFALVFLIVNYLTNRQIATQNKALVLKIQEFYYPELSRYEKMEALLREISREFQDTATLEEPDLLEDLDIQRDRFRAEARAGQDYEVSERLLRLFDQYYAGAKAITARILAGETFGTEYTESLEEMSNDYNKVLAFLTANIVQANENIRQAFTRIRKTHQSYISQLFWLTALTVVATTALTLFLSRRITVPLNEVVRALRVFSKQRNIQSLPIRSSDEIGELTSAFNKLTSDLVNTSVSKNAMQSIVEAIKEALIQVDPNGIIQMVNSTTMDLLGYKSEELVGQPLRRVIPLIESPGEEPFFELMKAGDVDNRQTIYLRKNGFELVMSLSAAPIHDGDGEFKGMVLSSRDLSETIQLIDDLRALTKEQEEMSWIKTKVTQIIDALQVNQTTEAFATDLATEVGRLFNVGFAAVYIRKTVDKHQVLRLMGGYGFPNKDRLGRDFQWGESLIGQAALEQRRILQGAVPPDYLSISTGLGQAPPCQLLFQPIIYANEVKAVLELASFDKFNPQQLDLVEQLSELLGILIDNVEKRHHTESLLTESQVMSETLQNQSEELQETNEQLEEQANALILAQQVTRNRNEELLEAQRELTLRAEQLAETNKYKTEFLANMSHELRTPLNSVLILSRLLADGKEGEERKMATTIYDAGKDLLRLIDDILDLAKAEAGKMSLEVKRFFLSDLLRDLEALIKPQATEKGLEFYVHPQPDLPETLLQDRERLQQVLNNLLANAIKFTGVGSVILTVSPSLELEGGVAFEITDTGIGIPQDKQHLIFEAFQQAEGATNRIYGGTGLGLAISRNIAVKLGGSLSLHSRVDEGSTFTLHLPQSPPDFQAYADPQLEPVVLPEPDSETINPTEEANRTMLLVTNEPSLSQQLQLASKACGYTGLATEPAFIQLDLVKQHQPMGLFLDIDFSAGWPFLNALLSDPETRHVPVVVISAENKQQQAEKMGVVNYLAKPVNAEALKAAFQKMDSISRGKTKLLIVEDDDKEREAIGHLMADVKAELVAVATGKEALDKLTRGTYACMILDLKLGDMSGYDLLQKMTESPTIQTTPTIVYTGMPLTREDEKRLQAFADMVMLKTVTSPSLLKETTSTLLHTERLADREGINNPKYGLMSEGKTILLVDDDWRNVYSLVTVLEKEGLAVIAAENGQEAIDILSAQNEIDLVLMDIMMPVMDGHEAIGLIRKMPAYKDLPIIALTAKAMKADREKTLAVGASDYLSKPVDQTRLFSLIKIWLANQ